MAAANGDAKAEKRKAPRFSIRLPKRREKTKSPKTSRSWELIVWAVILGFFALLTLWHWIALILNYAQ